MLTPWLDSLNHSQVELFHCSCAYHASLVWHFRCLKEPNFKTIIGFREEWDETITWFKENCLPIFLKVSSYAGLSQQTQDKIDIQAGKKNE